MITVRVPSNFTEPVSITRYEAGQYVDGEWQEGNAVGMEIRASVQPLTAGDYRLLPEGNEGVRGYKVYSNFNFQLGGKDLRPDEMTYQGSVFKLVNKEEWQRNGYTSAVFIEKL